ncbi:S-adenosyl-L-methionine-dependent methyltransferase [Lipomyces tetrasporus]|uniref:S-adenosyl-L-methionine-dependent methyltransferase n=1 Tax=Lipomyces tetrasporus TaxID=54092 RepID=A0AAD7QYB9_9ASCO|nr:S-adenosyl-L-methionine-dependent methyltransferase [Lipomyces tetrasporus]KAJ8103606.1 S-adenosyl-L-methionine-dependent methyltransferase [Lipomyces tetrasporus]
MTPSPDQEPVINANPSLQDYYASLESRLGYRLVLGGTRHFGYYNTDTYWPFPIDRALRAMEDHLFDSLGLETGANVLDAGCGDGHVAMHLAGRGLRVQGIDVVDRHVRKAQRNISARGLQDAVAVRKMDYHHLDGLADESFDGVYTMETFVHATDPEAAATEFFRVLKPGGSIALFEYDHADTASHKLKLSLATINKYAAMPGYDRFGPGILQRILEAAGFQDVVVTDLTVNVTPMLRLFCVMAYLPYLLIRLLGLQPWFVNTVAGVQGYRARKTCRYVAVSGRKPAAPQRRP